LNLNFFTYTPPRENPMGQKIQQGTSNIFPPGNNEGRCVVGEIEVGKSGEKILGQDL